ncbi:hypothetical protein BASA83_004636 [Batrachochytrium salamandrivorans]|nr:hypothetical protein BASA83_004636 [Batrachochytrium salamandrivorans]
MKRDLKDYFRCPQCQLNTSATGIHTPQPIRPVPPVALPFERWGIDFYGPMAETKSGNKYLITCIDYATRWIIAKPVKDMTEVEDVTVGMNISPSTFSLKDSHTCSHRILTILSIIWNTPPTTQDETPPRESQAPLDEIEEMEERSEFIARNLEEVGQARSAAKCRTSPGGSHA